MYCDDKTKKICSGIIAIVIGAIFGLMAKGILKWNTNIVLAVIFILLGIKLIVKGIISKEKKEVKEVKKAKKKK